MSRARLRFRQLPLAARIGALLLVGGCAWLALRGRKPRVTTFELRAGPDFWSENGYVEMVPRLTGAASPESGAKVSVWLHLPANGQLALSDASTPGRPLLRYPDGTNVVRVEAQHGEVTGACGMHLAPATNPRLFVLLPASPPSQAALHGYSWPRDDPAAQAQALDLIATYASHPLAPPASHSADPTTCRQCHTPARPSQSGSNIADAGGLFTILRVLASSASDAPPREGTCNARHYLFERLAPTARAAFRDAFQACSIAE